MSSGVAAAAEVDFIEELRLRAWARQNYVTPKDRPRDWHPVIHDEMGRKDRESRLAAQA